MRIGARRMHSRVQRKARDVHRRPCCSVRPIANELAGTIDLDQVGRGDLVEGQAESVDEEVIRLARNGGRQVGVDQVIPAVERGQSIGGGQVDAYCALGFADLAPGHNGAGAQGKRHGAPPMEEAF